MMRSLRGRLLVWVIGGMALLQIGFAAVVFGVMERSLREGFDAVLTSMLRTVAAGVEQDEHGVRAEIDERELPEFRRGSQPDYFEIRGADGEVITRSVSLGTARLAWPPPSEGGVSIRELVLPDGRRGREAALTFAPPAEGEKGVAPKPKTVTIVVARASDRLDAQTASLRWRLALGCAGTIGVSLLLAALIVRQGLRPLDDLASKIADVDEDDLSARVALDRPPAEIVPVVQRLNGLLQRLAQAFGRERAFSADVAHELRTPLAGLRATLEVALSRPRESSVYRAALSDCLGIVEHTQALVDRLLALARMEGGQTVVKAETLWLTELIAEAWLPFAPGISERRITFVDTVADDVACEGDRAMLLMALSAAASNASEYTDEGGRIEVEAIASGSAVTLTISNTGCRLEPGESALVFDRFWRGDPSRSDTGLHCGLGLTLVRQLLRAQGGDAAASIADGRFTLHLSLPGLDPSGNAS